jgi:hypothetical protein
MPQWNSAFFKLSLTVEGATEKVSQFKMPLLLIYNRVFCLKEEKCTFEHRLTDILKQ